MTVGDTPRIAILGLGEAGSMFADELAAHAQVTGFDPAWMPRPTSFQVADSAADAVRDADVVLALTAGPDAAGALDSVVGHARAGAVYADLSSSSPGLKSELAHTAEKAGLVFSDTVLLAPVLRARLATPVLAAGAGAARLQSLLSALGMNITVVGADAVAGDAAARKLLRSIVVKGLTALMVESLRAAEDRGQLEWFSEHLVETLSDLTPEVVSRLLDGTLTHSVRRIHEMAAAVDMIEAGGGDATMTRATHDVLTTIDALGIPRGSVLR